MKRFFVRALTPIFFVITILSAFLYIPHANAFFSRKFEIERIPAPIQATADVLYPTVGDYACILSDDTYFYTAAEGRTGLFLLPKSYYVRLVDYRNDYCKVEYQTDTSAKRLVGYVKTDALTFVDYIPARPYLYYVFDVKYTIEESSPTTSEFLTEFTVSCVYYGDYMIGSERYCYVLRGEEFGYIPKPVTLTYEENTEYADYLQAQQPESLPPDQSAQTPSAGNGGSSPAQIAILVVICLLVPILAALVLKPPRRDPYSMDDIS